MTPKEARKKLNCITSHYLCPVCTIPALFCQEHSDDEREYALNALKDIARRRSTQKTRRPKRAQH